MIAVLLWLTFLFYLVKLLRKSLERKNGFLLKNILSSCFHLLYEWKLSFGSRDDTIYQNFR